MKAYLDKTGRPMPLQINPAEFVLDLVSTDFATNTEEAEAQLAKIHQEWDDSEEASNVNLEISRLTALSEKQGNITLSAEQMQHANIISTIITLLRRSFIKGYRDVVAYGIRVAMYLGLAIMEGTVWLRLGTGQENIQPYINALVSTSLALVYHSKTNNSSTDTLCIVLLLCLHVIHGCCICAIFPRRPCNIYQGES